MRCEDCLPCCLLKYMAVISLYFLLCPPNPVVQQRDTRVATPRPSIVCSGPHVYNHQIPAAMHPSHTFTHSRNPAFQVKMLPLSQIVRSPPTEVNLRQNANEHAEQHRLAPSVVAGQQKSRVLKAQAFENVSKWVSVPAKVTSRPCLGGPRGP